MSGHHVEVGPVRTWYDDRGAGEPVVLLHGGLTDARDFSGNLDALAERYRVLTPERRGHGRTADVEGPIDLEGMAADTAAFLDAVVGAPVRLVGFSAGAIVALRVARDRPDLVERLVLVSGGFDHAAMLVRPEPGTPVPDRNARRHAELSPDGPGHVHVVGAKILDAVRTEQPLAEADLADVTAPTLVAAADDDVWSLEHTLALYRALPDAELAVVPGTSHALLHEKPDLCRQIVETFLAGSSTPLVPLRRAGTASARNWSERAAGA